MYLKEHIPSQFFKAKCASSSDIIYHYLYIHHVAGKTSKEMTIYVKLLSVGLRECLIPKGKPYNYKASFFEISTKKQYKSMDLPQ